MWQSLQIYHVNVNCTNLERSAAFYEMLGFREVINLPEGPLEGLGAIPKRGRAKLMRLGDDPKAPLLDLVEWTEPATTGTPYPHLAHVGIGRICLRVKGLDEMVAMLKTTGVRFVEVEEAPPIPGIKHKFVCFHDPDGSVLELMEFFK